MSYVNKDSVILHEEKTLCLSLLQQWSSRGVRTDGNCLCDPEGCGDFVPKSGHKLS